MKPNPRAVDPELIERARILRDQGKSLKAIGKELGRSQSTISRWLMMPELPDPVDALDVAGHRVERRKQVIDKAYDTAFLVLDRVHKDIKRGRYDPKHPPAVVFGIVVDKIVALEAAQRQGPDLPQGQTVNIFAEVDKLGMVFEKVADAGDPPLPPYEGGPEGKATGPVHQDRPDESLHPAGPQAAPEAGGVPPGHRPEDG